MTAPRRILQFTRQLALAAWLASIACVPGARAASNDAVAILEPGLAHAAAHTPAVDALVERIASFARARDTHSLVDVTRGALLDPALADAARERVLQASAFALAELDGSTDSRALLEELSSRAPAVRVWSYDGPHRLAIVLYDVAAAARYALARQEARRVLADALGLIAAGDDAVLAMYEAQPDARSPEARALVQAFESAPTAALVAYRDRLSAALERDASAAIAAVVARRLGDATLMRSVLEHADPALALDCVRSLRASFASGVALELLEHAVDREDVASAALFEIGALVADEPRARGILFDALDDDRYAGSAAAALAALHDPDVAGELRRRVLAQGDDERRARRAILALRLDASDAARGELARLAADPQLPAALRSEASR
jgi:hypothetical protein